MSVHPAPAGNNPAGQNPHVTATTTGPVEVQYFAYLDAAGKVVYRAVISASGTAYERPGKGNKWIKGFGPVPKIPYRLDLLSRTDPTEAVFIADDERGVNALTDKGVVAVCCVQDSAWGNCDWPPFLEGRAVAVIGWPDEYGRQASENVARWISGSAALVKVVEPPGLKCGMSVAEWVATYPTDLSAAALLSAEFDATDPFQAAPEFRVVVEDAETNEELGLTELDTVEPKALEWLWDDRFPLGKISIVAGDGGIGKSFMTLYMTSVVSRGAVWPDAPTAPVKQGHVILLSAEDDLADTIVPRLIAMGANLKMITALGTAKGKNGLLTPFTLQDIDRLERVMARKPGTRLIVIDPITAYLGPVDDHKNAALRGLLGPLSDFASRHRVAIIAVTHFNKSTGAKAADRVIGSVAYGNAARATWLVALDPENENRRLLMPAKANLSKGKGKTSMAYTITDGVVVWEADTFRVNANEILGGSAAAPKEQRRKQAVAWLQETLAAGGMPSEEVIEKAKAAGFGKDVIWKVKAEAGVRAKRVGFGSDGVWTWVLDASPMPPEPMGGNGILKMLKEPMGGNGAASKAPEGSDRIPKAPIDSETSGCGGCFRKECRECNPDL